MAQHRRAERVFFLFHVSDIEGAKAFTSSGSAEEAAEKYGVLEGNLWFVA